MATQINLPRDAAGREIPLDTNVLYDKDGERIDVLRYQYYPVVGSGYWNIKSVRNKFYQADNVYLTTPDSWEKLLEELDNTAEKASSSIYIATPCAWFSDGNRHCADCPADEPPEDTCGVKLIKDIAARIRKLRGECE